MLNGVLGVADMLRNGEYGSVARAFGFAVGSTVQIVVAKKGFEKCGELADKKKYGTGVESGSNSEVFYRTMSQADYDYLRMTGELPAIDETFISPT